MKVICDMADKEGCIGFKCEHYTKHESNDHPGVICTEATECPDIKWLMAKCISCEEEININQEEKLIIDQKNSTEYCFTLLTEYKDYKIVAKWDGCIHLYRAYNGVDVNDDSNEDIDYIHICDVDEFIKMLQEVKEKAQKWYNNTEW